MEKKTSTHRVRKFRELKRLKRLEESPNEACLGHGGKRPGAGRPKGTKTPADRSREYRQRLKIKRELEKNHGFCGHDGTSVEAFDEPDYYWTGGSKKSIFANLEKTEDEKCDIELDKKGLFDDMEIGCTTEYRRHFLDVGFLAENSQVFHSTKIEDENSVNEIAIKKEPLDNDRHYYNHQTITSQRNYVKSRLFLSAIVKKEELDMDEIMIKKESGVTETD